MDIAILVYDRFTALDAVGPYEVLSRLPGATTTFVATRPGPVTTDTGLRATTHWLAIDRLRELGARPVHERVVVEEGHRIVTAAGVSAGIDMGLALAARIAGDQVAQAIQLGIEYDPQPPFDCGSPDRAPAEIVELLRSQSRFPAAQR